MHDIHGHKYSFTLACGLLLTAPACVDDATSVDDEVGTDSGESGSLTSTQSSADTTDTGSDTTDTGAEAACGDGILDEGEECDDGNDDNTDTCVAGCVNAICGDGYQGPGEGCDDGNDVDDDACTNSCALASCGDAEVQAGEACDDGNADNSDACLDTCVAAACGDGHAWLDHEFCDDGNADNSDDCLDTCATAACGDGYVWAGHEVCDDANDTDTDACTNACELAVCGDNIIQEGVEECDDGNDDNTDNCVDGCLGAVCGDGYQGPGEGCDDGNAVNNDACSNACALASCGDALIQPGEDCDDANANNNDACINTCVAADCGDGYVWAGHETCDDGNANNTDACIDTCEPADCGDGYVWAGHEACDDGNGNNNDACINSCEPADCGDGYVWAGHEACDDANASDFDTCTTQCTNFVAPMLQLSLSQVKQFDFSWAPVVGADYYQLFESADVGQPYVQVGANVPGLSTSRTVPLHFRLNAKYKLRACKNGEGCTDSAAVDTVGPMVEAIGYFKASNTGGSDHFGFSVALSGDGNTLAVGAPYEDGGAPGIGGNQADNSMTGAGAVYVFVRNGAGWSQQAYVKASNPGTGDYFGYSVALSHNGNTLAVGAAGEYSNATGINGNQADNSAGQSGATYVFVRNGGAWSQQAYVKASNTGANDNFGLNVALSGDGNTMSVAAQYERSNATGINGNQNDDSASASGAAYVFVRSGLVWSQQAYVKASNTQWADRFGMSMGLSVDGNTLAVGADGEDSNATGIGGNQANNSAVDSGAVYVFVRNGGAWAQQAYVKASNAGAGDQFGAGLALSGDGNTLAVGAYLEDSSALNIGGNQADNSLNAAGAVYVFVRGNNTWSQQAYVKASNANQGDVFGSSVALSAAGDTLAVGAYEDESAAVGLGGNQADNSAPEAGAVYVLVRSGNVWAHKSYVKASNTAAFDRMGYSVLLSLDASMLVVGASGEASNATGIAGNQANNAVAGAGAVYVY